MIVFRDKLLTPDCEAMAGSDKSDLQNGNHMFLLVVDADSQSDLVNKSYFIYVQDMEGLA